MTQEEKELLIKDLCSRLPYGPKVKVLSLWNEDKEVEETIVDSVYCVMPNGYINTETIDSDISLDNIVLYLRPMESMTLTEECEFCRLFECDSVNAMFGYINWTVGGSCDYYDFDIEFSKLAKVIDWLNAHHFDYRGLIPMGLALPAPEDMYK